MYLLLHPSLCCYTAPGSIGRAVAWLVFITTTLAAIIGGVLDWHLPYAAWLADPTVQPRTFMYSYFGMMLATLGQLWAPARLMSMPPKSLYGGGCCGPAMCCVKLEEAEVGAAEKGKASEVEVSSTTSSLEVQRAPTTGASTI